MTQTVLGIDPGAHGALALLSFGNGFKLLGTADMPIRDRGKTVTNNVVDGRAFGHLIREWNPSLIVVEDVQPMPSRPEDDDDDRTPMPARSAFAFGGFALGVVTACEALGFDVVQVRPAVWKKTAGLPKARNRRTSEVKADALALARKLWPEGPFVRAKDEAKAEAALIARFGASSQLRFL